jgi:indoleamine 2,3-dioxygenase
MPGKHRDFLKAVSALPSIRPFVQENASNSALQEAYNQCVSHLRSWRGSHIAVVSKYIVRPARLAAGAAQKTTRDSPDDEKDDSLTGTGGSALIPFLRQSKDETAGI